MKTLKGIAAIVFFEKENKKKFLILHRLLHWRGWEIPKGSVKNNEKLEETVKRELFEETGIKKIFSIKKLSAIMRFFDPIRKCNREMHAFLVEVSPQEDVSIASNKEHEHDAFEWADAQTVLEKLTYDEQKKILATALKALER